MTNYTLTPGANIEMMIIAAMVDFSLTPMAAAEKVASINGLAHLPITFVMVARQLDCN